MESPNAEIINLLERLAQIADIRGDTRREKAYRGAALGISRLRWSISASPWLLGSEKIPGVGRGILRKITEYVETGSIAELVDLENSSEITAYKVFTKIAGVGPRTAADWVRNGIYDLATLRRAISGEFKHTVELNTVQKYGLIYYADLNERIPRAEVAEIGSDLIAILRRLDKGIVCEIVGSYRRGAETSGDIDIITSGGYSLKELEVIYRRDPSFIATFSIGVERFTFIYRGVSGRVRQIDVLKLPLQQYWSGLLYFTGSWEFNAAMRGYAKSKGFLLNQRGLFKKDGKREIPVEVASERDIFDKLELKYVEPAGRVGVNDIVVKK
jgi:DNA polymerase beta